MSRIRERLLLVFAGKMSEYRSMFSPRVFLWLIASVEHTPGRFRARNAHIMTIDAILKAHISPNVIDAS
jgi:hypothetical protein